MASNSQTTNTDQFTKPTGGHEKRIAKNTIYLYIRTIVIMLVSLYTSRVALHVLGEEDFGIYNLVAGFVVLFGFLNFAMERATLRFLLVEKGKGTISSMSRVFCISVSAHMAIAAILLILAETIGLWFVNSRLNVPDDKIFATNWVYQLAVLTTILNIIRVPYNSSIIAYEKMSFYAYFSIMEAVVRLAGVMVLQYFISNNLLESYAAIWAATAIIVFLTYKIFCTYKFPTCNFKFVWDKKIFVEMLIFSGWNMLGGVGNIAAQQGIAVIMNLFFNAIINAAVGITYQVGQAINNIISSFQTAFNPRLVKLYVNNETEKFNAMLISTSKFSYYLCLIMIVPIIINIDEILHLWLGNDIPPHTANFCVLYLIFYAIDAVSAPLWMANQATGKVRTYNIVFASMLLLNLPFCYIAFRFGAAPEVAFVIRVAINFILHIFRIGYLHFQVGLTIGKYVIHTLLLPLTITTIAVPLPFWIGEQTTDWQRILFTSVTAIFTIIIAVYFIGLTSSERKHITTAITNKIRR